MNSQFTDEQIKAYAAQFRESDAIWCNGKWRKVSESPWGLRCKSPNRYVIHCYDGEVVIGGFKEEEIAYRVTTLEDYKLQGGEKIVRLGESDDFRTFGKVYETDNGAKYRDDKGILRFPLSSSWGVIPRYEQVKNKKKEDDKVAGFKAVKAEKYTGKYKVGDKVKIIAMTKSESLYQSGLSLLGIVDEVFEDANLTSYNYKVELETGAYKWCNEATLELVEASNVEVEKGNVSDEEFDKLLNEIDKTLEPIKNANQLSHVVQYPTAADREEEVLKLKIFELFVEDMSDDDVIDDLKDIAIVQIRKNNYDKAIEALNAIKEWEEKK